MAVPNIFGTATAAIPLSQLDTNFATPVTIGNTAVQLGNTVTSFGNVTLTNVTISSGNVTVTSPAIFPAGTAALPAITTTGDTNTGIFFPAADTIAFSEGGVEAMRIDSSGNLGLGVTPSAWSTSAQKALQVYLSGVSSNGGGNTASRFTHGCYLDGSTWKYQDTGVAPTRYEVTGANGGSTHSWSVAAGGTAGNAITFTQAMTLDASGRLGIGETSPTQQVHAKSASTTYFLAETTGLGTSPGFRMKAGASADYTLFTTEGGNQFAIYDNVAGSERLRIDSSGNLLVGTTNAAENAGVGFKLLTGGQVACVTTANTTNAQMTTYEFYSTGAGAFRFYVGAGGTIFATSTSISAISDQRLKENVRPLDLGLAEVLSLQPRRFDWIEGKGQNKKDAVGFIAQEFEVVLPNSVGNSKAGEDGIEYKNINYEELMPTLVKAIQEQQALITQLTARITALEGTT